MEGKGDFQNNLGGTCYCLQDAVAAPLYQQVADWFLENHNIKIDYAKGENPDNFYPVITDYAEKKEHNYKHIPVYWYETHYQALNSAIGFAFKLIKVKK